MEQSIKQKKVNNKNINIVFLIIIFLLIAFPSFFRGLYFEKEQLIVYICSGVFLLTYSIIKISQRSCFRLNTIMDFSLVAIVGAYILTAFTATYPRGAIIELLKYVNYLIIYLIVREFAINKKSIHIILHAPYVTGIGTTLIGFAAATGAIGVEGSLWEYLLRGTYSEVEHMILGTFQYHNAYASFVLAMIFIGFTFYCLADKLYLKVLYNIFNFILLFGFVFSYSRGAWLLFPLILITFFIMGKQFAIKNAIASLISTGIAAIVCMKGFANVLTNKQGMQGWYWILTGILISIVATFVFEYIVNKVTKLSINPKVTMVTIISVTVVSILSVIFIPGLAQKVIPSFIMERIKDINLSTYAVQERFAFYIDSFKMFMDFPIFGVGGGGWQSVHFKYQSYLYWSTQPHSYIIQILTETGILGFAAFVFLCYSFIKCSLNNLKSFNEDKQIKVLLSGAVTAGLSLLVHSFIDFDLSLSGITIVLWSLFGIIVAMESDYLDGIRKKEKSYWNRVIYIKPFIPMLVSIVLLVVSITLSSAGCFVKQASSYIKAEQYEDGMKSLKQAVELDPLNPEIRIDYANLLYDRASKESNQSKRQQLIKAALDNMKKTENLNKYNSGINANIGAFYLKTGNIDEGLEFIEKSVELQPLRPQNYLQKATAYIKVAELYLKNNEIDKAKNALQIIINIEKDVEGVNARILKTKPVELDEKTKQIIEDARNAIEKL